MKFIRKTLAVVVLVGMVAQASTPSLSCLVTFHSPSAPSKSSFSIQALSPAVKMAFLTHGQTESPSLCRQAAAWEAAEPRERNGIFFATIGVVVGIVLVLSFAPAMAHGIWNVLTIAGVGAMALLTNPKHPQWPGEVRLAQPLSLHNAQAREARSYVLWALYLQYRGEYMDSLLHLNAAEKYLRQAGGHAEQADVIRKVTILVAELASQTQWGAPVLPDLLRQVRFLEAGILALCIGDETSPRDGLAVQSRRVGADAIAWMLKQFKSAPVEDDTQEKARELILQTLARLYPDEARRPLLEALKIAVRKEDLRKAEVLAEVAAGTGDFTVLTGIVIQGIAATSPVVKPVAPILLEKIHVADLTVLSKRELQALRQLIAVQSTLVRAPEIREKYKAILERVDQLLRQRPAPAGVTGPARVLYRPEALATSERVLEAIGFLRWPLADMMTVLMNIPLLSTAKTEADLPERAAELWRHYDALQTKAVKIYASARRDKVSGGIPSKRVEPLWKSFGELIAQWESLTAILSELLKQEFFESRMANVLRGSMETCELYATGLEVLFPRAEMTGSPRSAFSRFNLTALQYMEWGFPPRGTITFHIPKDLPDVYVNPELLRLVLMSILRHGWKSPEQRLDAETPLKITVGARADPGRVRLTMISPGLLPDEQLAVTPHRGLPRLWEADPAPHQLDRDLGPAVASWGIGILGGLISVRNIEVDGDPFIEISISLPSEPPESSTPSAEQSSAMMAVPEIPDLRQVSWPDLTEEDWYKPPASGSISKASSADKEFHDSKKIPVASSLRIRRMEDHLLPSLPPNLFKNFGTYMGASWWGIPVKQRTQGLVDFAIMLGINIVSYGDWLLDFSAGEASHLIFQYRLLPKPVYGVFFKGKFQSFPILNDPLRRWQWDKFHGKGRLTVVWSREAWSALLKTPLWPDHMEGQTPLGFYYRCVCEDDFQYDPQSKAAAGAA